MFGPEKVDVSGVSVRHRVRCYCLISLTESCCSPVFVFFYELPRNKKPKKVEENVGDKFSGTIFTEEQLYAVFIFKKSKGIWVAFL